jgi:hypothetical protein
VWGVLLRIVVETVVAAAAGEAARRAIDACQQPQLQPVDDQQQADLTIWLKHHREEKRLERNRKQRERRARAKDERRPRRR